MVKKKLTGKEKEKVLEKIQKLLDAQGDGAVNETEIANANLLMKKLLAKYDIEIGMLDQIKRKKALVTELTYDTKNYRPKAWSIWLGNSIAKFYDCKLLHGRGLFYFIGFEVDAKVAMNMFDYLYWNIFETAQANSKLKTWLDGREKAAETNDFCLGAENAISRRLLKMKAELNADNETTALVVAKGAEIKDFISDLYGKVNSTNAGQRVTNYDTYITGRTHGNNVSLNKQVK